jgi:hypothetical protein
MNSDEGRSFMRKVISAARFAAFAMVATVLTGEAAASTSRAMQFHCTLVPEYSKGDLSKDDAWIADKLKAFMPEPGAPSLKITSMEQVGEFAFLAPLRLNLRQYAFCRHRFRL